MLIIKGSRRNYLLAHDLVKEGKTGDQLVKTIEPRADQVLAVMAQQFQNSKHGKAAVLQLLQLTLLQN